MSKPPVTTPHSDIDGVHEDEKRNVDAANAAGQTGADLERANKESAGRPDYSSATGSRDDRSR